MVLLDKLNRGIIGEHKTHTTGTRDIALLLPRVELLREPHKLAIRL